MPYPLYHFSIKTIINDNGLSFWAARLIYVLFIYFLSTFRILKQFDAVSYCQHENILFGIAQRAFSCLRTTFP